jgi:hypothetical protein
MRVQLPQFTDKRELIDYLVKNKEDIIDLKKSATKEADSFGGLVSDSNFVSKAIANTQDTEDTIYRTIVGNTYNWMDSHDDVHLNNLFSQSIKDRGLKIRHQHDHINQLTAKVGKFSGVYEQVVNWTDVGVNKVGQTMALLGDSAIRKMYNQLIFEDYKDGSIDQHSVGMMYVKMFLGVNDKQYKEEFETWNKYFPLIGNPEKATEKGYAFFIKEAKLLEISCVTEGSNELTGIYNPPTGSLNTDPPNEQSKSFYSLFLN